MSTKEADRFQAIVAEERLNQAVLLMRRVLEMDLTSIVPVDLLAVIHDAEKIADKLHWENQT